MLDSSLRIIESGDKDCLKVYTLGSLKVKSGGKVISNDCKRSQQLWNLFKYIFTYRNKRIIQENFFDVLWNDNECDNPGKALQNLIYRLRMLLDYKEENKEGQSIINYSQGCYSWNKECNYWTDVDEFENLYNNGKTSENNKDFDNAIEIYQRGLSLYKGDYLSDDPYNEWVTPLRNYYHRIYIDIICRLTKLLRDDGRIKDVLKVCEEALMIQQFEEKLYVIYIEALIETGNMKQAQNEYKSITSRLYNDMGVKPSTALRNLYHRIKCNDDNKADNKIDKKLMNLDDIREVMVDRDDCDGAFFCDPDIFSSIYKLDCRKAARGGQVDYMGMITISVAKNKTNNSNVLKKVMRALLDMLIQDLREGDVVSEWSGTQVIVLLSEVTLEQADGVLTRILNKHEVLATSNNIIVEKLLKPISSIE
ncbi:BTAD domain-containing putative transcriptional regulator [Clostridium sp.]|uniref:BTAD domain-containing putative transcriptional regulator n=1 Tax=Clostridium sp. TaxID=1506 RepID=UPI0026154B70|nr:BTAD domain-containing putative transcriptional regulator [uncultured Clostridium sp.]